ncbi:hypothetical protein TorRG33x02_148680, partial [Trema orientale]
NRSIRPEYFDFPDPITEIIVFQLLVDATELGDGNKTSSILIKDRQAVKELAIKGLGLHFKF